MSRTASGRSAMGASQAQYFCRMTQKPVACVKKPCAGATPLNKSNEVSNVIKEAFILRSLRSLSKLHWSFFTYHGPSLSLRLNPRNGYFSGLGSQIHWTCSYATPLQSAVRPRTPLNKNIAVSNEEKKAVECGYSLFSASLSKSHRLFFTSGTTTPPRKKV